MINIITSDYIKTLPVEKLEEINNEIRKFIINQISKTGGHLGASLGVIELTTALHYSFNSPKDTIIWDIGHQSYAHKIFTGRLRDFHTIRTYGGLSGFTNPKESEHDHFFAGHSSTSVSLGIGVATAKALKNDTTYTIAVIGDGAISSGMAFEAMNNVSAAGKKFITILNDNDMSISPPAGAISRYLPKLFMSYGYQEIKSISKKLLSNFPNRFFEFCSHTHKSIKGIVSGDNFFEELGYEYIGPVDGHNTKTLIKILQVIKDNATKPVLLHVITKKGNGYKPAENAEDKFHGVKPFDIPTGKQTKSTGVSCSKFVSQTITDFAHNDHTITTITPAMKQGSALDNFATAHPNRFFDVGIAEQHAVTFAAGQVKQGLKPFCFLYSTFLQRAYDQIIHDVALQKLPVRFIIDRSGLTGEDGPTHHGIFDIAALRIIPNIEICNTFSKNSITAALNYSKISQKPLFIRIPKENVWNNISEYTSHKCTICKQGSTNNKKILIASGRMLKIVIECGKYDDWTVIDPFFIKPLDSQILTYIKNAQEVKIFDENSMGGISSIILEECNKHKLNTDIIIAHTIPNRFITHGSNIELLTKECYFDI